MRHIYHTMGPVLIIGRFILILIFKTRDRHKPALMYIIGDRLITAVFSLLRDFSTSSSGSHTVDI